MENINVFLVSEQVVMLFLIGLVGIYCRKVKILDRSSTQALSKFLTNVTQPFMIITSFQIDFDSEKLKNGFTILGLSVAIHIFVSVVSFFIYKPVVKDKADKKIYEISSIFTNCAFLGYPVLKVIFGELGIFYGSFYTVFFNIFIWTYGVYTLAKDSGVTGVEPKKINPAQMFLNAGFIASVAGLIVFIFRIKFPSVIYNSSKLIGDMTFPLAMIIIGSLISDLDLKSLFFSLKNYYYIFIKLFALPITIAIILYAFKVDTILIYVGTIMSCMPTAANVAIFAETYGANSALASKLVGLSTLISVVSIPVILYILNFIIS